MKQASISVYLTGLLLFLLTPACVEPDEITPRQGLSSDCSRWRCGYNTSEINGKSLQELNLDGLPNSDGVRLMGFVPASHIVTSLLFPYKLGVDGDALVADNGFNELRGHDLLGSTLLVRLEQGVVVPVVIAGYEMVESWADPGTPVAAYSLLYTDLQAPFDNQSICKGTLVDPLQASVVILAGERYDLDSKQVLPGQDGWITLACAGSAAAKMALMGYGPHAEFADEGSPATVEQREATLKMLTGDYCGGGESYTADGTPLQWQNAAETFPPPDLDSTELEAIWTADGAVCLNTPRYVDRDEVACSLPTCDHLSPEEHEWASYLVDSDTALP